MNDGDNNTVKIPISAPIQSRANIRCVFNRDNEMTCISMFVILTNYLSFCQPPHPFQHSSRANRDQSSFSRAMNAQLSSLCAEWSDRCGHSRWEFFFLLWMNAIYYLFIININHNHLTNEFLYI